MQNAGIAALGLNWRYLAFDTPPDRLSEAIAGAKAMRFVGLNLTVPHKLLALDLVDELDETARRWGAVNTIRFEAQDPAGHWKPLSHFATEIPERIRAQGFNTDADALERALREDLELQLSGLSVLVLGVGGAGRVAALKLASAGAASIHLVNRTASKAEEIAQLVRQRHPSTQATPGYPHGPVDLVVNATSLGLKPEDPPPFDPSVFSLKRAHAAYDLIYRPSETRFLSEARKSGCRAANGLGMLLHQGVQALELWSGQRAPVPVMRQALEQNLYER